jgi:hypothetical protein
LTICTMLDYNDAVTIGLMTPGVTAAVLILYDPSWVHSTSHKRIVIRLHSS